MTRPADAAAEPPSTEEGRTLLRELWSGQVKGSTDQESAGLQYAALYLAAGPVRAIEEGAVRDAARALRWDLDEMFGPDCRDDGSGVCDEHAELLIGDRCEDSPEPMKAAVLEAVGRHFPAAASGPAEAEG